MNTTIFPKIQSVFIFSILTGLGYLAIMLYFTDISKVTDIRGDKHSDTTKINRSAVNNMSIIVGSNTEMNAPVEITHCSVNVPSFEEAVTQQFSHIMTLKPNFTRQKRHDDVIRAQGRASTHAVQIGEVCVWNNMHYLQLSITEKSMSGFSTGGSAFMVRIQHVYLLVCPVTDHFNGTYTVQCPLYDQRSANISILIKHIDFSGFNGFTTVLEKTIWTKEYVHNENTEGYSLKQEGNSANSMYPRVDPEKLHNNDTQLKQFVSGFPAPLSDDGHWFRYCYNSQYS